MQTSVNLFGMKWHGQSVSCFEFLRAMFVEITSLVVESKQKKLREIKRWHVFILTSRAEKKKVGKDKFMYELKKNNLFFLLVSRYETIKEGSRGIKHLHGFTLSNEVPNISAGNESISYVYTNS